MTNQQAKARQYCRNAGCNMFHRCQVYWGRNCIRLSGRKVPRTKMPWQMQPKVVEVTTTKESRPW